MQFMERKLIPQGVGGYTIYLPSKWVEKKGLTKKDSVHIQEVGQSLVVRSEKKQKLVFELDISGFSNQQIKNQLTHIYRAGYDIIKLKNMSDSDYKLIKKIISDVLLGFEITDKQENVFMLENISEPSSEKYYSLLRRILLIVKEMHIILETDFNNGFNSSQEIADLKLQQDKLILFCKRLLSKHGLEKEPVFDWELLTFTMHIAHNAYYLYMFCLDNDVKISKNIFAGINLIKENYGLFYDALFSKNVKLVEEINKNKNKVQYEFILKSFKLSDAEQSMVISLIREQLRLIQIGTSPVLSLILNSEGIGRK